MDPQKLIEEKEKLKEQIREQVLQEINQQYYLTPKSRRLDVNDIFTKYRKELVEKGQSRGNGVLRVGPDYTLFETIKQSIRRIVCMHYGVGALKDIPKDKYEEFRAELERVIVEYIGIERKD